MIERERIFDAFRNCITDGKCKECPWTECKKLNNKRVDIPIDLCLAVLRIIEPHMVVYIVTNGEYSDYHIEKVFDNLNDAKKYYDILRRQKYSYPSIEVYNVGWQSKPEDVRIYYTCYNERTNRWFSEESNETNIRESHVAEYHTYYVEAKDNAHAMKIAYDRHAIWKAMQEGIA